MTTRTTVAIAGGGPAGTACAVALGRLGIPVTLVEMSTGSGNPLGESLASSATPLFHALGVFAAVMATHPLPCHGNRSSWGGEALEEHDFLRDPHGPGWHLDRPAFNAALLGAAAAAGADCRLGTRVRSVQRDGSGWRISLAGPAGAETLLAELVVDAAGRPARIARLLGAVRVAFDRLVGAVATLEPRAAPLRDSFTLVEARPEGWWYSALLPDGRLAAAFFTDPDLLAARAAWTAAGWTALLDDSGGTRERVVAGGYVLANLPSIAPAGNTCLQPAAGDGWLAVGDAAAAYDPLSSHGIGSALAGGRNAAAAIALHLAGDPAALPAYADRIAAGYARYLKLWLTYYAQERRWPEAPFWRRRQAHPDGEW
ncbi:MAG: Dehydrogenase flavoprotein LodB [uncultured Thermomicrobiales bacterium]|uniref:Dehydrogenase flavoprotein LodB n=1 Tax=uncultured Thermomicrobiales bacterium TaxID=1645740 RepID=A0A6J4VJY2_9BACT|nr:MAG: Dehydrogenase flavoprotein LodB [uncultured Thermomicrobiales bacterium]